MITIFFPPSYRFRDCLDYTSARGLAILSVMAPIGKGFEVNCEPITLKL